MEGRKCTRRNLQLGVESAVRLAVKARSRSSRFKSHYLRREPLNQTINILHTHSMIQKRTYDHSCPPYWILQIDIVVRCVVDSRPLSSIIQTLKHEATTMLSTKKGHPAVLRTFLVMMKLVPIASEPEKASKMPIYLSSSMPMNTETRAAPLSPLLS